MDTPGSAPGIRVLVVDDSVAFREVAHELIDDAAGFVWAGEAGSGEDGVEQTLRLKPDMVLLDVRMPGIDGIEAATRIAAQAVPPPVVVLITGEELPVGVLETTAAEVVPKGRLSRVSLERVWEDHGCR
jgi:DNA-binding NarL/FixJ family response regulator